MKTKKTLILLICFGFIKSFSNVFTVTNTQNSGNGSLIEAINNALYYPGGPHSVAFNIPTTDANYNISEGTWTITLSSELPYINKNNITIDAETQTMNQGNTNTYGPEIVLDGNNRSVDFAFFLYNANNVTIRGFCIKDFLYGIQIFGNNATGNKICGNYIGTNPVGTQSDSCYIGIEIIGGAHDNIVGGTIQSDRNIVSGNAHIGIRIVDANSNIIIGNYIGTDRVGTFAIPNYDGMSIEGDAKYNRIGGYTVAERNIVSGNYAYGIPIFGAGASYNTVVGNYVGTDVTGTQSIPNTYGLLFDDGACYNTVGGSGVGARNLFSGNSGYGVFIYNMGTNNNILKGNFIGTDASGTAPLPNANGIVVDGAPFNHLIDSNVISGNLQQGIAIHITFSDNTKITRNFIGTDFTGQYPLGNGMDGIQIAEGPKNTIIGGTPWDANTIAYNHGNGIAILTAAEKYNSIRYNRIFKNLGLGIDLYPPGVTSNDIGDADDGPNGLQNFPTITSAIVDSINGSLKIEGTIDTQNPSNVFIDIYKADTVASVYGEGSQYMGTTLADANGNWTLIVNGLNSIDFVTSMATSSEGNSSEFSQNREVVAGYVPIQETDVFLNYCIFPNPTSDIINCRFNKTVSGTMFFYSVTGTKIREYKISNQLKIDSDISNFPCGNYKIIFISEFNTFHHLGQFQKY